ncbi:MAG: flippase-like domain-containing protein, partial [Promicromonosporaceae bacterium]|nr:flippase-like domain-containing protein [Promicromonosporaceae bacterium]
RGRRRTVRWGYNLLTVTLVLVLTTGAVSLPGTLIALLLAVVAAGVTRLALGVDSERAYGADLEAAIQGAGFVPQRLERLERGGGRGRRYVMSAMARADQASPARRYDVVVLDGDRQVLSLASRWLRALKLRGFEPGAQYSLKGVVDHSRLLSYAALDAGVRTPHVLGVGMVDDSAVLVVERHPGVPLAELDGTGAGAAAIATDAWRQLARAHAAGLAHRDLSLRTLTAAGPQVSVGDWQHGETLASPLSQGLDRAQLLVALSVWMGPEAALGVATAEVPEAQLQAIGPLLQAAILPGDTRERVKASKALDRLREAFAAQVPEATTSPAPIERFSLRSVIMLALTIVAVFVVVTTFNFTEILGAVRGASPGWIAVAFAAASLPWLGAAMALVAFAPGRLPLGRTVEVQMASSFIALAAPAGIGPAGVNLRYMYRRGVATPVGLATTALVQLTQIGVTVAILGVLLLTQGSGGLVSLPSGTVIWAIAAVAGVAAAAMAIAPVRRWVWARARPTLSQVRPRFMAAIGQPGRLALGLGGNVLHALAYVLAFYASLHALGHPLRLVDAAVIYLVGNTIGALLPTPGGLGGVEGALVAGLTAAGIPAAIGLSITLLFRVASYWVQVPIGWFAMRYVQRQGDL